jgi:L-alanine-DL-glutamate epimerase-like enolase superfamily enzyme
MKIKRLETFLANAGLRNYLFVRLVTDTGLTGIGEASLEWQERAVEILLNEWVAAAWWAAIRSTSRTSSAAWSATSTRAARQ